MVTQKKRLISKSIQFVEPVMRQVEAEAIRQEITRLAGGEIAADVSKMVKLMVSFALANITDFRKWQVSRKS